MVCSTFVRQLLPVNIYILYIFNFLINLLGFFATGDVYGWQLKPSAYSKNACALRFFLERVLHVA